MLYDSIGVGYTAARQTDPRWLTPILKALGDARSVLDVGSGTGSYEPADRQVLAVEPSAEMVRQRPPGSAPVIRALAEGRWHESHQDLLALDEWDAGFRLIVSRD